jgi:hypothetical protein
MRVDSCTRGGDSSLYQSLSGDAMKLLISLNMKPDLVRVILVEVLRRDRCGGRGNTEENECGAERS